MKKNIEPLKGSDIFHIGLSKANAEPVLYYWLKNENDLPNYFVLNDMAQRVHAFYQQQSTLSQMWVGVVPSELQKTRIETIRLYYINPFTVTLERIKSSCSIAASAHELLHCYSAHRQLEDSE